MEVDDDDDDDDDDDEKVEMFLGAVYRAQYERWSPHLRPYNGVDQQCVGIWRGGIVPGDRREACGE